MPHTHSQNIRRDTLVPYTDINEFMPNGGIVVVPLFAPRPLHCVAVNIELDY